MHVCLAKAQRKFGILKLFINLWNYQKTEYSVMASMKYLHAYDWFKDRSFRYLLIPFQQTSVI